MILQVGNYQIRKYNNLCWELYQYKTVVARTGEKKGQERSDWISLEIYPHNLSHALEIITERELKKDDKIVKTAKKFSAMLNELKQDFYKMAEKVENEIKEKDR